MKKWNLIIPMFLLLASCSSIKNTDSDHKAQINNQQNVKFTINRLNDIWALVAVDGESLDYKTNEYKQITLEIKLKDSIALGMTGCNNFQAKVIIDGYKISFPPFPMTQKFCPGYENVFVKGIGNTASYKIEGLKLYFYDKEGKEVLQFKKVD